MTEEVKNDTEAYLAPYADYLAKQGFKLQRGQVVLRLQPGMGNAHYYPNNLSIVMDPRVVTDKSVMRREYNHHALSAALGSEAEEIFQKCSGIESGLADYLGCSSCDDPVVGLIFSTELGYGIGPLRTMDNDKSFEGVRDQSGRHAVGEVVSGALWEMREAIGKEELDRLLFQAWIGLVKADASSGQIVRFAHALLDAAQTAKPETAAKIQAVFERRGLVIVF